MIELNLLTMRFVDLCQQNQRKEVLNLVFYHLRTVCACLHENIRSPTFPSISWQDKLKPLKPRIKKPSLFKEQRYEKSRTLYYNKNREEFLKIVF